MPFVIYQLTHLPLSSCASSSSSSFCRHLFTEPHIETVPSECIVTNAACVRHLNLLTMESSEQDIVNAPFVLTRKAAADSAAAPPPAAPGPATSPELVHGICLWFDVDFTNERFPGVGARSAVGVAAPASSAAADDDSGPPPLEDASAAAPTAAAAAPSPPPPRVGVIGSAPAPSSIAHKLSTSPFTPPTHWAQTLLLFDAPIALRPGETITGDLCMTRDADHQRRYRFLVDMLLPGGAGRKQQSFHLI